MKKILSLVLSACMMLSAAALAEGTFTPADSYDVGERVYNAGTVTLEKAPVSVPDVIDANGTPIVPFHAGETLGWRLIG